VKWPVFESKRFYRAIKRLIVEWPVLESKRFYRGNKKKDDV
jgi:hypothetical protein